MHCHRNTFGALAGLVLCAAGQVQQGVRIVVPREMVGIWVLTDTAQCAGEVGKIVVTLDAVIVGARRSERVALVPKSGVGGGDVLHWWMAAKEEIFEYEADNDRIVWHSRGADYYSVEYYERCR